MQCPYEMRWAEFVVPSSTRFDRENSSATSFCHISSVISCSDNVESRPTSDLVFLICCVVCGILGVE